MRHLERLPSAVAGLLLAAAGAAAAADPAVEPAVSPPALVRAAGDLYQTPAGIRAAYIRGIQLELLAHGYDPGSVDGIAGARTRDAIRAYQLDAGLTSDGEPSQELLDHLKFVLPKVNRFGAPVMGIVLQVQRELATRGYYLGPHDGLSGPATRSAVWRFRADARLPAEGGIDSRLLQQIRDAPAEIKASQDY